jgi:hypothetical protein
MNKPPIEYTQNGHKAMKCFIKYIRETIIERAAGDTRLLVKFNEIVFEILAYIDGKSFGDGHIFVNLVASCDGSSISGALHDELTECMIPVLLKDKAFNAQMMVGLRKKSRQRKKERVVL